MQPPEKMALEGPLKENNLLEKAEVLSTEVDKCTINEFKVGAEHLTIMPGYLYSTLCYDKYSVNQVL